MHRIGSLDPHPEGHLPYREGLAQPAALSADHHSLEHLDALSPSLSHPSMNTHRISRTKVREIFAQARLFDGGDFVHRRQQKRLVRMRMPMLAPSCTRSG